VNRKRIVRRDVAQRDLEDAARYYLAEAGFDVVDRFVEAFEAALDHIATHPASGSPRYAQVTGYPTLRCWPLKRFSYLVFYVEHTDSIDVWRLLHASRDIPEWLREGEV
jgi:toxin ParE1/3/4